jgi:hypothetical protein
LDPTSSKRKKEASPLFHFCVAHMQLGLLLDIHQIPKSAPN